MDWNGKAGAARRRWACYGMTRRGWRDFEGRRWERDALRLTTST